MELRIEQIRSFRLQAHHLDRAYEEEDIPEIAGACGLQNTPPGAWETALFHRVSRCSLTDLERLLYEEKLLLQAWSFRGIPVVFPASESHVFLSGLVAVEGEPWIYTQGIGLALDFLQMDFDGLFGLLRQVIGRLDGETILSKTTLDQTLAEWMMPLLPAEKRDLWNQPSMYGNPDKQTVGGAAVSFLLRPCAFEGLVVFGQRQGTSPAFTSYKGWTGHCMKGDEDAGKKLVRKYLHCYGPATLDSFVTWMGCSRKQGRRLWESIAEEMEPVMVHGKKTFILASDRERLFADPSFERDLILLGGHDPFLDQRDRWVLQPDKGLQKQIWKTVSNPGAIVCRGEVVGVWNSKKKPKGIEIKMTLWNGFQEGRRLSALAEEYAAFRQEKLLKVEM